MGDDAAFFPGFATRSIGTEAGTIFVRVKGEGPPLLLLHGFPETGVMWHALAPRLAEHFTVVVPDLRGYGWSSAPSSHNGEAYTKRAMGADAIAVMEALGHSRFALAGHDRGARVGYRLALDHPGRLTRLALLDIVPTVAVWRAIEGGQATSPHWPYLAKPEPEPENEIKTFPDTYFAGLMAKWTKAKSLAGFHPQALQAYRDAWGSPDRIHAMCEDYRAGAHQDRAADEADLAAGTTISCPTHIIASADYLVASSKEPPLAVWQRTFAPTATGTVIDCGHFMAEENGPATLAALLRFLEVDASGETA